jgi:hypothetical protein
VHITILDVLEEDLNKLGNSQKIKLFYNLVFTHTLERLDFAKIPDLLRMTLVRIILLSSQDSKRLNLIILKPLKLLLMMVQLLPLSELVAEFLETIPTVLLTQLLAHQLSQSMNTIMLFSLLDTVKLSSVNNTSSSKTLSERTGEIKDMQ